MEKQRMKTIAVSPGGTHAGLAVFHDADLHDWQVRSLGRAAWIDRKKRMIELVTKTASFHGADILVMKSLHPSRSSQQLRFLVEKMKKIAGDGGIQIREYSISQMKAAFGPGCRNKLDLMESVAARYPFLYRELEREKKTKKNHFTRMFEAVALGVVGLADIEKVVKSKGIHG